MSQTHAAAAVGALAAGEPELRLSELARTLPGSEILRIATEIRSAKAAGRELCDLTVGDFNPRHFPIPDVLRAALQAALDAGETNYPPPNGLPELREAVRRHYARELGLEYAAENVLLASGSRPLIYCLFRTLVDPGEAVAYPVPSWNTHYYVHAVGARGLPVRCGPERRFLPDREALREALGAARLLCLNSPLNPAGTVISEDALRGIAEEVLAINRRREQRGERPLFVLYDHIYWMLRFGSEPHLTPPGLLPELARYTLLIDGISKAFAATGLRVGWALGPADVLARASSLLAHVGAWPPRAEQRATVALLDDVAAIRAFGESFRGRLSARLTRLHQGFEAMRREGLPVECVAPMGAIYLSVRFHPFGRRPPGGAPLRSNDEIRRYLLEAAAVGLVPFQAFGWPEDDGWFRISVGGVGEDEIEAALPRMAAALRALA